MQGGPVSERVQCSLQAHSTCGAQRLSHEPLLVPPVAELGTLVAVESSGGTPLLLRRGKGRCRCARSPLRGPMGQLSVFLASSATWAELAGMAENIVGSSAATDRAADV